MSSLLQITLGIVTAMGGFIDIGELVFSVQAGVKFGYLLLWAIVVGTIGIITYSEMSGRIAAVLHQPVFQLMKKTFHPKFTVILLIASSLLNILTCAAEVGGVAIVLQLLTSLTNPAAIILTVAGFIFIVWVLPYKFLEKSFGLLGLLMISFLIAVFATPSDTSKIVQGLIPQLPSFDSSTLITYFYFAVGIISSSMMPYELYFYSSGGIEEKWTSKDILDNKLTSVVGMLLGGLLSASLVILGAKLFIPFSITPQLHGTAAMLISSVFGKTGLLFALFGILFTIGGAAVETCLAGAYNIAQYFNWPWGRYQKVEETPQFSLTWVGIFILAGVILFFKIDPVDLVEYAVIFSVMVLPFTYYPILKTASDKKQMGKYSNGWISNGLGWIYLILITVVALAAIPLMILSSMGQK